MQTNLGTTESGRRGRGVREYVSYYRREPAGPEEMVQPHPPPQRPGREITRGPRANPFFSFRVGIK